MSPVEPSPAPPTIAPWLAAARDGDTAALGRVLEYCRAHLLEFADRQLGSHLRPKAGASDLVQEAFLDAARLFDRFEGDDVDQLLAWLRAILVNRLRTVVGRYRGTEMRAVDREVPLGVAPADDSTAPDAAADGQPSPSGLAADAERAALIRAALDRLPEHYRQVLVWRHWDDLTFEEIARRLDKTPDAARMLWGRAVARLERVIEPPP